MAITAYTGPPGSGKSYALVSEVILPALAAGRRVLSNVAGLKPEAIAAYLEAKKGDPLDRLGELVLFDGRQALEPGFWPDPENLGHPATVHGGDLVVFDEVGLYWPTGEKFPPLIVKYLRYHRHHTDTAGQSTDIVLATQGVTDIHRAYRSLVERTYKFKKLSTLGLKRAYVYSVWEGASQRKGEAVANGQGRYDKEIFPLYSSFQAATGIETTTDKRANIFRDKRLWVLGGGTLAAFAASAWFLYAMFSHPHAEPHGDEPTGAATSEAGGVAVSLPRPTPSPSGPPPASQWRIAGTVQTPEFVAAVLSDKSGAVLYLDISNCTLLHGRPYVCNFEGQRALSLGSPGQTVEQKGATGALGGVL